MFIRLTNGVSLDSNHAHGNFIIDIDSIFATATGCAHGFMFYKLYMHLICKVCTSFGSVALSVYLSACLPACLSASLPNND